MPALEMAKNGNRFVSQAEVRRRYDISSTTLWRWPRERGFPKPVRVGGKNMWLASEVAEWEEKQIKSR